MEDTLDARLEEELIASFARNGSGIKTLFSLYKGNYLRLAVATIFFLIKRLPEWVLPFVTANIINIATSPAEHTLSELIVNVVVMAVVTLQNIPTNYIYFKLHRQAIRNVEATLRQALVRKLQQLSIAYHNAMKSGRLQSKIMRDVEAIEALSSQLFIGLLQIVLDIAISLTVTASKSLSVFLFFVLTIPAAVTLVSAFRGKIRLRNREFRREVEETSAMVMEMVELIPVTRAHGLEGFEIQRMGSQLKKVSARGLKLDVVQELFGSLTWVTFQIFQLACLAFTGYLAFMGKISIGEVVMYQSYFSIIVHQVSSLIALLPTMSKGMESVRSVGDVLEAGDIEDNRGKKSIKNVRGEVEFRAVGFEYPDGERCVLKDFNLHVREGETIALVGPSGAGKTTILNLVIGFFKAKDGSVLIDGNDITKIDLTAYRHHIAVVPQNTILFSGTVRENILYGTQNVSEEKLREVIEAANLEEVIENLPHGLETLISEHGANLSGGQRQRIAIARALVRDPKIIVLDEATSALDTISEKKIQKALENLVANRTTFIVAHRLSTVRNADRIAVIDEGKCIECGTFDELMAKKGEFYAMNNNLV